MHTLHLAMDSVLLKDALKPPHSVEVLPVQHRVIGAFNNEAVVIVIVVVPQRIHCKFCLYDVII